MFLKIQIDSALCVLFCTFLLFSMLHGLCFLLGVSHVYVSIDHCYNFRYGVPHTYVLIDVGNHFHNVLLLTSGSIPPWDWMRVSQTRSWQPQVAECNRESIEGPIGGVMTHPSCNSWCVVSHTNWGLTPFSSFVLTVLVVHAYVEYGPVLLVGYCILRLFFTVSLGMMSIFCCISFPGTLAPTLRASPVCSCRTREEWESTAESARRLHHLGSRDSKSHDTEIFFVRFGELGLVQTYWTLVFFSSFFVSSLLWPQTVSVDTLSIGNYSIDEQLLRLYIYRHCPLSFAIKCIHSHLAGECFVSDITW